MSGDRPYLEVVTVREAVRTRVRLRGELDLATAPAVSACLRELRERGVDVLLDLDELTFIDASGIRLMLTASSDASRDGWGFSVTSGSAPVQRLFGLLELDGHIRIDESGR